jgi:hypothetical protein
MTPTKKWKRKGVLKSTGLAVLWGLLFCTAASSQIQEQARYFVKLSRTDFEAGYNYEPAPVGTAQIGCAARKWSAIMDWGDGTFSEALSHEVPAENNGHSRAGVYPVFSHHRYLKLGSFDASVKLSVHCTDKPDEIAVHQDFHVEVFGHVPIKAFASESDRVKRGSPVALAVELETAAPDSGTRIFLKYVDGIGAFQSSSLPKFVDVAPGERRARLEIPTVRIGDAGTITVTAIGANGPHSQQIEIQK